MGYFELYKSCRSWNSVHFQTVPVRLHLFMGASWKSLMLKVGFLRLNKTLSLLAEDIRKVSPGRKEQLDEYLLGENMS